jgi:hypothetical protein
MPKVDIWARPIDDPDYIAYPFTSNRDGTVFEFFLKPLTPIDEAELTDRAQALIMLYLGDPLNKIEPKMAFPNVGNKSVRLSKRLVITCSQVEAQQPKDVDRRYKFEDIIALAVTDPEVFKALMDKAFEIQGEYDEEKSLAGETNK